MSELSALDAPANLLVRSERSSAKSPHKSAQPKQRTPVRKYQHLSLKQGKHAGIAESEISQFSIRCKNVFCMGFVCE